MSNYYLDLATNKCGEYGKTLDQREYDELLKWAKIMGYEGDQARKALYQAKELRNRYPGDPYADNFRYVWSRDQYTEESYARYY